MDLDYNKNTTCDKASVLFEADIYYRAVYEAFQKAEKSIFILGWDIDSRIQLLRGEDRPDPSQSYDLLSVLNDLATRCPDLQIYLLKWAYAPIYLKEREPLSRLRWMQKTPPNIHVEIDGVIPMSSSHHQKIILIDDALAFNGGMDIALARWDTRDHNPVDDRRRDPLPTGPYHPYHDMQAMVSGPIVRELAHIVRWRWFRATGIEAVPYDPAPEDIWLAPFEPDFENIETAVILTFPKMAEIDAIKDVESFYLDHIQRAERFIYIENQFFTHIPIAEAINRRLREKPDLQVLMVGPYDPKGPIEQFSMWQGRLAFKNAVEDGVDPGRVIMVTPFKETAEDVRGQKHKSQIRVHSKIMIIDDRIFHVGSSNLNGRSMGLDSECDLAFYAETDEMRQTVSRLRNEFIALFTEWSLEEVKSLIEEKKPFRDWVTAKPDRGGSSITCFEEIDDTKFVSSGLKQAERRILDPEEPLIPEIFDPGTYKSKNVQGWKKGLFKVITASFFLIALITLWHVLPVQEWANRQIDRSESYLSEHRNSVSGFAMTILVFTLLGTLFFPVTMLIALTASVFGAVKGFGYAMVAITVATMIGFGIGHLLGVKILRRFMGLRLKKIDSYLHEAGVGEVAVLRMLPVAPFGFINLAAGISSIRFMPFTVGSVLGMVPGSFALAILGGSLTEILQDASPRSLAYFTFGITLWLAFVYGTHRLMDMTGKNKKDTPSRTP